MPRAGVAAHRPKHHRGYRNEEAGELGSPCSSEFILRPAWPLFQRDGVSRGVPVLVTIPGPAVYSQCTKARVV